MVPFSVTEAEASEVFVATVPQRVRGTVTVDGKPIPMTDLTIHGPKDHWQANGWNEPVAQRKQSNRIPEGDQQKSGLRVS